ncbi:hypothetical protein R6Q57_026887 [Mikania cordata]
MNSISRFIWLREGEVCMVVVSIVGEMKNWKYQQKRDYQLLTGESDREPVARRQGKVDLVDVEVDFYAMNQSEVAIDSIEEKPCASRLPTEEKLIWDVKQAPGSLNYVGVTFSVEQPDKEGLNDMERDPYGKKCSSGVSNGMEMVPVIEQPVKECLNETGLEPHGSMQRTGVDRDIDRGFCIRVQTTGAISDIEPSINQLIKECLNETETDACVKIQSTEPLIESEPDTSA